MALPGSGYRRFSPDDVDRLRHEMLTQLAPADTGPVVKPRRPVKGRIVHGDDTPVRAAFDGSLRACPTNDPPTISPASRPLVCSAKATSSATFGSPTPVQRTRSCCSTTRRLAAVDSYRDRSTSA